MSDQAKMLEKVRALLAKAAATPYEGEADVFRQKADELMTRYAIDQWQVDQVEADRRAVPKPVMRKVDITWWYDPAQVFSDQLWYLFNSTARHCRCRSVPLKVQHREIPVFGLQSDLDWHDLLFTDLMLQMIQKVDPQPRSELTLMENLAMFREAGVPWEIAINRMIKHGDFQDVDVESDATFEGVYKPWVHEYRRWCRATGHSQSYVNQRTYRKHFADGFADEIDRRLREMARMTQVNYDADHEANSAALALRDIWDVIQESIYAEFPELRPHAAGCQCERCQAARRSRGAVVRRRSSAAPKIDWAARNAGAEAGRQADISGNPSRRVRKTPELGEG